MEVSLMYIIIAFVIGAICGMIILWLISRITGIGMVDDEDYVPREDYDKVVSERDEWKTNYESANQSCQNLNKTINRLDNGGNNNVNTKKSGLNSDATIRGLQEQIKDLKKQIEELKRENKELKEQQNYNPSVMDKGLGLKKTSNTEQCNDNPKDSQSSNNSSDTITLYAPLPRSADGLKYFSDVKEDKDGDSKFELWISQSKDKATFKPLDFLKIRNSDAAMMVINTEGTKPKDATAVIAVNAYGEAHLDGEDWIVDKNVEIKIK